jgi:hypothetical protein
MKARIQLAALLLPAILLAGCSRDAQPPVAASAQSGAEPAAARATTKHLKHALPKGIQLDFAYNLRRDRVEQTKSGAYRRKVRLEYLDIDREQALAALTADITAAGYKAGKPKQVKGDGIRVVFKQKNQPTIAATVRADGKLKHPSARGLIYLSMPAKAPTARAAAKPAVAKAG